MAVSAPQALQRGLKRWGGAPPRRSQGQLQSGRPAFRLLHQGLDTLGRQVQARHLIQEGPRLFQGKAQVVATHLGHLAARPQPGQRDERVAARREQQVQLRGRLRHQAVDKGVDQGAFNKVVIFQNNEYVLGDCLHDLIDEHNEEALPLGLDVLDALQQRTRGGAKLGAAAGNTFDEIL